MAKAKKKTKVRKIWYVLSCIGTVIWQGAAGMLIILFFENLIYAVIADTSFGRIFPAVYYISCMIYVMIVLYINAKEEIQLYRSENKDKER